MFLPQFLGELVVIIIDAFVLLVFHSVPYLYLLPSRSRSRTLITTLPDAFPGQPQKPNRILDPGVAGLLPAHLSIGENTGIGLHGFIEGGSESHNLSKPEPTCLVNIQRHR